MWIKRMKSKTTLSRVKWISILMCMVHWCWMRLDVIYTMLNAIRCYHNTQSLILYFLQKIAYITYFFNQVFHYALFRPLTRSRDNALMFWRPWGEVFPYKYTIAINRSSGGWSSILVGITINVDAYVKEICTCIP